MNDVPTAAAQFGYTLALAERTLTQVLHAHLAERGTEPGTWYGLQLLTMHGGAMARDAFVADLAGARSLSADLARQVVGSLEAQGLVRGDDELQLTDAGRDLHGSLRDYVAIPRTRLLSQFVPEDIETTVRTLQAITEKAQAEVSSPAEA